MKATTNGIDTYYELHGKEGAPWLAFSHSLACSLRMWEGEIALLKDRFRILAYDTRGHGRTSAPAGAYTLDQMADDLRALLDRLGIEKLHFVGLSMGGMIGQVFALKYPGTFASLVLANTTSRYPAEVLPLWQDRIRIAETKGMQPLVQPTVERWFTEAFRKSRPEAVQKIAAGIGATPVPGYVGCCHAIPRINVTARLKEIKCPVLVIGGDKDPGTPPAMQKEICDHLPGAKLTMIPEAAHLSNVEQPQAFGRALEGFLTKR